jgi:hypothetical protein
MLGIAAVASVLVGGLALLIALENRPARTKIVHVIVTTTARTNTAPRHRITPANERAQSNHRTLPPASAGTNGSSAPLTGSGSVLKPGASASFARLQATLPGAIGLALSPLGNGAGALFGTDTPAHGWSTTKVPVLVALMRARGAEGLTATEQGWAQLAITESDNQSILNLFGDLENLKGGLAGASDYVQAMLRQSGDDETVVATAPPPPGAVTTFGQTEWAPSEAVKFFRAFANGCLLPGDQTAYVLNLMQHIVPSESWGFGEGGFSVPVAFKGGWGPEPNGVYLVRQSGIIDPGSSRGIAFSAVAHPPTGGESFAAGTEMLTTLARWLREEIVLRPRSSPSCQGG